MKIIVTGAGGFIGGHTVLELQRRKYEVLPLDVRDSILFPQIKITKCDILSSELKDYINEGDKILHLCAMPIVLADPRPIFRVNVEGTINLVQFALEKKAERIVMASSGAVYFGKRNVYPPLDETTPTQPNTYYGFSKVVGEQVLAMHSQELPWIALRYGYVYGYGDKGAISIFLKALMTNKRATIFWGKQHVEMVYIDDIVQANIRALETNKGLNEIYNIGSGTATSIREIYNMCATLLGKTIEPTVKPLRAWDPPSFWFDIRKAMKNLGYNPIWTLTEGIKQEIKDLSNTQQLLKLKQDMKIWQKQMGFERKRDVGIER